MPATSPDAVPDVAKPRWLLLRGGLQDANSQLSRAVVLNLPNAAAL